MAETQNENKTKSLRRWPRRAKGGEGKQCSIEGCKRPYRAKSYCYFHFKKWRHGDLPHTRYRTCSKVDCRKPTQRSGLCEQHYNETFKKAEGA